LIPVGRTEYNACHCEERDSATKQSTTIIMALLRWIASLRSQ
jgi:hypothetical protein